MSLSIIPIGIVNKAGFRNGPIRFHCTALTDFQTIVTNLNEYRSPDEQIKKIFSDRACTKLINPSVFILFTQEVYIDSTCF